MQISETDNFALIQLPSRLSLYEDRAESFVSSLFELASELSSGEENSQYSAVLLFQKADAVDSTARWNDELQSSLLLDDLAGRILVFRGLSKAINNCSVPFVYVGSSNCLGSYWELALSCHYRLWFNKNAIVGFPEIYAGVYPPSGVLERTGVKRIGKVRGRWDKEPVLPVKSALDGELLDVSIHSDDAKTLAMDWCRQTLDSSRLTGAKSTLDASSQGAAIEPFHEGLAYAAEEADLGTHPTSWECCWHLLKGKNRPDDPAYLDALIAHISAQYFLSSKYRNWLARQLSDITTISKKYVSKYPSTKHNNTTVAIDLSKLAPPTAPLVRLLKSGVKIAFFNPDSSSLSSALALVYGRLERHLHSSEALALWNSGVSWFQGSLEETSTPIIAFSIDDYVSTTDGRSSRSFLRLEGNRENARCGLLESIDCDPSDLNDFSLPLLQLMADGLILTKSLGTEAMPASILLRSLFFDEIMRLCKNMDGELAGMTRDLKANGWRFAASESGWDNFLKTNHGIGRLNVRDLVIETDREKKSRRIIGSWRQARNVVKKLSDREKQSRWFATAISGHMAVFLGVNALRLYKKQLVSSIGDANRLCIGALGFPDGGGTPVDILQRWGKRRLVHYCETHWPEINPDEVMETFDSVC